MKDLIVKEEPQKITNDMCSSLPEKIELYDGELEGAEQFLQIALYGVGLRRLLALLPQESKTILKELLDVEMPENWRASVAEADRRGRLEWARVQGELKKAKGLLKMGFTVEDLQYIYQFPPEALDELKREKSEED